MAICNTRIVGSLAAVITDAVRHQLLGNGINLGLVSSAFWFMGANFLWSQDFWSGLQQSRHSKYSIQDLGFLLLLTVCGLLASVTGPASALLFLPSQGWLAAGNTDFYLYGTNDMLWPQHITTAHSPAACLGDIPSVSPKCHYGGWETLKAVYSSNAMNNEDRTFDVLMLDGMRSRENHLVHQDNTSSTWAVAMHMATLFHAKDLTWKHDIANSYAKGNRARIRDAGLWMLRTKTRVPVLRTACGPLQRILNGTNTVPFPVLDLDNQWKDAQSELKDAKIDTSFRSNSSRLRASWLPLPGGFGGSTVGLALVVRNETWTVARGCTVDARWANGEIELNHGSSMGTFETWIGQTMPPPNALFPLPAYYFPFNTGILGKSITADEAWIESIAPLVDVEVRNETVSRTTFETFFSLSAVEDVTWLMNDANTFLGTLYLE